jgi:hypothetical protein
MFRLIWPSSDVKIILKIVLKSAALFHLRFPASCFRSIVHWCVLGVSCHFWAACAVCRSYAIFNIILTPADGQIGRNM